jgi:parallel beta-helix repeat protein
MPALGTFTLRFTGQQLGNFPEKAARISVEVANSAGMVLDPDGVGVWTPHPTARPGNNSSVTFPHLVTLPTDVASGATSGTTSETIAYRATLTAGGKQLQTTFAAARAGTTVDFEEVADVGVWEPISTTQALMLETKQYRDEAAVSAATIDTTSFSRRAEQPANILAPQFGAVGDGVANDTAALAAAIATGRDVIIPEGTYRFAGPMPVTTANQTIRGVGRRSVLVKTNTGDGIQVTANNVTLRDFSIETSSSGFTVAAGDTNASANFDGFTTQGLWITCTSTGDAQGIRTAHVDNIRLLDNTLTAPNATGTSSFGINVSSSLRSTYRCIIRGNTVDGFYDSITLTGTGSGLRLRHHVDGNIVTRPFRRGINAYHCPRSRVTNNHVFGDRANGRGTGWGIWADSSFAATETDLGHNNIVAGNVVHGFDSHGIVTEELVGAAITGNTVVDCGHGITLGAGTHTTTVTGNTCSRNTGHGIWGERLQSPGGHVYPIGDLSITGNVCRHNGMDGMRLAGLQRDNIVSGNNCSDNGLAAPNIYAGIRVCPGSDDFMGRVYSVIGNTLCNGASTGSTTNTGGIGQQAYGLAVSSDINGATGTLVFRVLANSNLTTGNTVASVRLVRAGAIDLASNRFDEANYLEVVGPQTGISLGQNFGAGEPTQNSKVVLRRRGGGPGEFEGTGSPESVVLALVGSTYRRTDGGAGTSFYVKETGTGTTGWVAK